MQEIFPCKNHAQIEAGKLVPDLFVFLKKALHKVKQVVGTSADLVLDINIKTNFITIKTVDLEICSISNFY